MKLKKIFDIINEDESLTHKTALNKIYKSVSDIGFDRNDYSNFIVNISRNIGSPNHIENYFSKDAKYPSINILIAIYLRIAMDQIIPKFSNIYYASAIVLGDNTAKQMKDFNFFLEKMMQTYPNMNTLKTQTEGQVRNIINSIIMNKSYDYKSIMKQVLGIDDKQAENMDKIIGMTVIGNSFFGKSISRLEYVQDVKKTKYLDYDNSTKGEALEMMKNATAFYSNFYNKLPANYVLENKYIVSFNWDNMTSIINKKISLSENINYAFSLSFFNMMTKTSAQYEYLKKNGMIIDISKYMQNDIINEILPELKKDFDFLKSITTDKGEPVSDWAADKQQQKTSDYERERDEEEEERTKSEFEREPKQEKIKNLFSKISKKANWSPYDSDDKNIEMLKKISNLGEDDLKELLKTINSKSKKSF